MRKVRGNGMLGIEHALDLVQALIAGFFPSVVGMPAEITCAGRDTIRVKTGVLVERDEVRRVRGAKDMTAVTAVVTTQEETERGAAGGRVAIGGCFVGLGKFSHGNSTASRVEKLYLPVVLGGQTSNITQRFILHPFILGQFADGCRDRATVGALHGRAAADGFVGLGSGRRVVQAVEGTGGMDAARWCGRRGLLTLSLRPFRWTQGCRDVERRLWRPQLAGVEGQMVLGGGRVVVGGGGRGGVDVGSDSSHIQVSIE